MAGWDIGRSDSAAMIGFRACSDAGLDIRAVVAPVVTVVIGFGGGELIVDSAAGQQRLTGFVAGLRNGTMRVRGERAACVEVRLPPARAYSLGVAPIELGGAVVDVDDIWGYRARRLRDRLTEAETWHQRFALTRSFLAEHDQPMRRTHPEVVASWERIAVSRGQVTVGELTEACGWSRKRRRQWSYNSCAVVENP